MISAGNLEPEKLELHEGHDDDFDEDDEGVMNENHPMWRLERIMVNSVGIAPRSSKSGKMIVAVEPSRKSEQRFRDEVRSLTARWTHCVAQDEVIKRVNRYVQGWVNYFHLHNSTRAFARQRFFLE
jgi:hypothetical protein